MIEFCTSFARDSDQIVPFMDSWNKHNFKHRLHVFYEGGTQGIGVHSSPNIIMQSLDEDPDRAAFLNKYSHMPVAQGVTGKGIFFQYQAVKFCHKVFAQSFRVPLCDWYCWLDSDVEFTKPFDDDFLNKVFPPDKLWVTLDREHLPETGIVGWRVSHPVARASLDAYRRLYATGEIFRLTQWDDCWAFRHIIRNEFANWSGALLDLCDGLEEQKIGDHPWPNTILGEYMIHKKGPARKREAA